MTNGRLLGNSLQADLMIDVSQASSVEALISEYRMARRDYANFRG